MSRGARGLLERAPAFRLLFLATLGSGLGTMLAVLALTVDVYERTGSAAWVSVLLIADFLPTVAIGLLLGPLVDRLSRRRLMVGADLVRLLVFVALPFAPSAAAIVALAFVAGIGNGFFRPAAYAGIPRLVEPQDLPRANGLLQAVDNLTWLVGPLAGGVLLAAWGPDVPYLVNAATFAVSAVLVARIPVHLLPPGERPEEGHWGALLDGFRAVVRSRPVLTVLVAWSVAVVGNAAVNVSEVFLVRDAFRAGNLELGLLLGAAGAGLVGGSLLGGPLLERRSVRAVYPGALLAMAAGAAAAAAVPTVWLALPCVVVTGLGNGVAGVCNPLLVQTGAEDRLRGRVFTVVMAVNFTVLVLAMGLAGPITDAVGPRAVWAGAAALYVLAAAAGWLLARGVASAPAVDAPDAAAVSPAGVPVARAGDDRAP